MKLPDIIEKESWDKLNKNLETIAKALEGIWKEIGAIKDILEKEKKD